MDSVLDEDLLCNAVLFLFATPYNRLFLLDIAMLALAHLHSDQACHGRPDPSGHRERPDPSPARRLRLGGRRRELRGLAERDHPQSC